jgi:hypothetical protein
MNNYTGKTGNRQFYRAMASDVVKHKTININKLQLKDNRPIAVSQRKLQKAVDSRSASQAMQMVAMTPELKLILTSKMGVFENEEEGKMAASNMAAKIPYPAKDNPGLALHWKGLGLENDAARTIIQGWAELDEGVNAKPESLNSLWQIKNDENKTGADRYADELSNAYLRLGNSKSSIGKELAEKLAHDGTHEIEFTHGVGENVAVCKKTIKLKLIIQKGIPGEFISPFQDKTKEQCAALPDTLTATILWDPSKDFAYYKPRPSHENKVEADPGRRGDQESMESWVVLAHELGHFTDFLMSPEMFMKDPNLDEIEKINLFREQEIVKQDLGKTPRLFYKDFVGGENEELLNKP